MTFRKIRSWVGTVRDYSRRHRLELLSLMIVLALTALITTIAILKPMPPRTLTMAAGQEGSATIMSLVGNIGKSWPVRGSGCGC